MEEPHIDIGREFLDESGRWPPLVTFELENGESRHYELVPEDDELDDRSAEEMLASLAQKEDEVGERVANLAQAHLEALRDEE